MVSNTTSKKYKLAVVIGRFQLKHIGHQLLFNKAASLSSNVLVLIGSAFQPRTIKNPFTYHERAMMVKQHFTIHPSVDVCTLPLTDSVYSNDAWLKQAQKNITGVMAMLDGVKDSEVCIVGLKKDSTSFYLDMFPQYKYESIDEFRMQLDATSIRNVLYTNPQELSILGNIIPSHVKAFLDEFVNKPEYTRLLREFKYYAEYKQRWGDGPFVTTDALIKKSGHSVLIQRDDDPGEGLWALPGGFLELDETIFDGCIREIYEETSIDLPPGLLRGSLVKVITFDDPNRSLRGRVITHLHVFDLDGRDKKPGLPSVKGSSDARVAGWKTNDQILDMRESMFEDHPCMFRSALGLE